MYDPDSSVHTTQHSAHPKHSYSKQSVLYTISCKQHLNFLEHCGFSTPCATHAPIKVAVAIFLPCALTTAGFSQRTNSSWLNTFGIKALYSGTLLYGHPLSTDTRIIRTPVGVPLVLVGLHCSSTLRLSFFLRHTRTTGRIPAHSIRIPATVKDHL